MALGGEVVDLVRLHLLEHAVQRAPVGQIGIMERVWCALGMQAAIDMGDAAGVERARPPHDPVDLVALGEQEFGQMTLARNPGDQRALSAGLFGLATKTGIHSGLPGRDGAEAGARPWNAPAHPGAYMKHDAIIFVVNGEGDKASKLARRAAGSAHLRFLRQSGFSVEGTCVKKYAQSYDACFLGLFRSPKGVGEAPRAKLTAARAVGLKIAAVNVPGIDDRLEFPGLDPMEVVDRARKLAIFLNADNFVNLDKCVPRHLRNDRHVIGEWYWELPRFPEVWLPAFDNTDEIWVASEFVRRVVAKSTEKPVRVIPPMVEVVPVDPERGAPEAGPARRRIHLPGDLRLSVLRRTQEP